MLKDMLEALMNAGTPKDKERAYKNLEKVGMDRRTADLLVKKLRKEDQK